MHNDDEWELKNDDDYEGNVKNILTFILPFIQISMGSERGNIILWDYNINVSSHEFYE